MSLGNSTGSPQGLFAKIAAIFVAILVIAPWEGAKALYKRVYDTQHDWDEIVYTLFAFVGTLYGGFFLGSLTRAHTSHSIVWLFCGFVGCLISGAYACPLLWLFPLKYFSHGAENIWKAINKFAQAHFENAASGVIGSYSWLPFSKTMWDKVVDPTRKSFAAIVVKTLLYPTLVVCSGALGYSIFTYAQAMAHGALGFALSLVGGAVGFLVFTSLADLLCKFLHYGKIPAVAILVSLPAAALAAYFAFAYGIVVAVVAFALAAAVIQAYVVPGVLLMFSDVVLNWVIKTLKPLLEGAYEQSENPARRLLGQTINFAVTALIGLGAWWVCSAIALPLAATASIVVLALALAYTLGGKVWDSDAGNYLSGSVFALATGFTATYGYHHFGWLGGNFAADTVGVVTAVTSFCLVYPLFLLGYQRVFNGAITAAVSGWLVSAHEALWKPFDKLVDQCGEVYYSGYRQDGDFNKLVLHLFNGLVAIALPVAGFFGLHHFVMAHYIVSSIAAVLVVLFSYVVGGRYILRGGVELVGGVVGLGTAIAVGVLVSSLQTLGWWLAGPLAVVCGSLVFCLLFPALFIGARYVCDPTVTKCLLPILAGLYDRAWARFGKVWLGFVAVYHAVVEFLKPYWNGFTTRCSNAWASVMAAWHGMFGR